MNNKRFPYLLLAIGSIGMLLYPRLLPSDAPSYLRSDLCVGFVYGLCIGIEIVAVLLVRKQRRSNNHMNTSRASR
jgi:hypothetical protein